MEACQPNSRRVLPDPRAFLPAPRPFRPRARHFARSAVVKTSTSTSSSSSSSPIFGLGLANRGRDSSRSSRRAVRVSLERRRGFHVVASISIPRTRRQIGFCALFPFAPRPASSTLLSRAPVLPSSSSSYYPSSSCFSSPPPASLVDGGYLQRIIRCFSDGRTDE